MKLSTLSCSGRIAQSQQASSRKNSTSSRSSQISQPKRRGQGKWGRGYSMRVVPVITVCILKDNHTGYPLRVHWISYKNREKDPRDEFVHDDYREEGAVRKLG